MYSSHNCSEFHDERDSLSPEKSKRRLKTPAQVQALEKFYSGTIAALQITDFKD